MCLPGFGGAGDDGRHARRSQPAGVSGVGLRDSLRRPRLGGGPRRTEHALGERVVVAGHRRQVLLDGPLDALDRFGLRQRRPLARHGSLVDGDRTLVRDDVPIRAAVDFGDGDAARERFAEYGRRWRVERPDDIDGVARAVDRVHPLLGEAGVGGPSRRSHRARAPALVRDDHVGDPWPGVVGRPLTDDSVVGAVSRAGSLEKRPCALAADLLTDEGDEPELAVRIRVPEREHRRRDGALHVGGPPAVEPAVAFFDPVGFACIDNL